MCPNITQKMVKARVEKEKRKAININKKKDQKYLDQSALKLKKNKSAPRRVN